MRPWLRPLSLITLVFSLWAAVECLWFKGFTGLDQRLSDLFLAAAARRLSPDPEIVIIGIDERSLAAMQEVAGSWPWPRAVHGELLLGLARQRPRAVVFDILFSEPDRYRPESDRLLNEAMAATPHAYVPMVRLDPHQDPYGVFLAQVAPFLGLEPTARVNPGGRAALLLPQAIAPQYWRTGTINFSEDPDGVGRRYQLYSSLQGWKLWSLPARVARDLGYALPPQADMVLSWRGRAGGYRYISYIDLYEDLARRQPRRDPRELTDKIVLIGALATGLHDLRVTPVSSVHPGVEILATALDNLKNQTYLHSPARAWVLIPTLLLILGQFVAFQRRRHALIIAGVLLIVSSALLVGAYLLVFRRVLAPAWTPMLFAWGFYFSAALQGYFQEQREREQVTRLFTRFLDARVVQELTAHGATPQSLSGQSREISVLFSDIRGFTTLSETSPPQAVVDLLNRYFSRQVATIFRHGGTLDKFIGDAIMAFWGAPHADPDHAVHAVSCALEMTEQLAGFKRELGATGDGFDIGIGIHTGTAVVGFIGSEHRLDYTAVGDTVNLASRIEGLTKGVARVLVSEDTRRRCGQRFDFVPHGSYKVKGRSQEVELFEPRPRP